MKHHFFFATIGVALLAALVSCTGDPTRGGIFWSESKAQERQDALQQEVNARYTMAEQEVATNKQLTAKRNQLLAKQRELQKINSSSSADAATRAQLIGEIERLQRELDALSGVN